MNTLKKLLMAAIISAIPCSYSLAATKPDTEGAAEKFRVVWTDDPTSTMTIGWCQNDGTDPYILYRDKNSSDEWTQIEVDTTSVYTNSVRDSVDGVVPEEKTIISYFTKLTNLTPDSDYEFVVADSLGASEVMWFRTAPDTPKNFTFIAGGDSRTNKEPRVWGNQLVSKIRPLFIAHGGDYMDYGDYDEWVEWLDEWQETISSDGRIYPIIPTHGNHENDVSDMMQKIFNIENVDAYGALSIGGDLMRIYSLNTELEPGVGYSSFDNQDATKWNEQSAWLQSDMESNPDYTWKVASFHRPMRPHTSAKSEGTGRIEAWADTFYDNGLNLAVECDTHMVKHTFPLSPSNEPGSYEGFVRDDENGIFFTGEGSWGAPNRPTDDDKPWTMVSDSVWQFKLITVSPENMELRTVLFGREIDYKEGILYDVDTVTELTQAEQDSDAFALPVGLNLWESMAGEVVTLPFEEAKIDNIELISTKDTWKYDDSDTDNGTDWILASFDDSSWSEGTGQFGYGDGDEDTLIDYGLDEDNKTSTYYFRNTFTVEDASEVIQLKIWLLRDDGAIVYINGVEALRSNMAKGAVSHNSYAASAIGGSTEDKYFINYLMPQLLQDGENTIAVEVHQSDAGSSDLSFDMALVSVVSNSEGDLLTAASDFSGQGLTTNSIELSWSAIDNARGYQLEFYDIESESWSIYAARVRADATSFEDTGLDSLTEYTYRIRAYNENGLGEVSEEISVSTLGEAIPVLLYEPFETELGQFTEYSASSNYLWINGSADDEAAAYMNGYGADEASEDWLISPAVNMVAYASPTLSFETYVKYGGGDLEVLVSTDYTGSGDPELATWFILDFDKPEDDSRQWTLSDNFDLSAYSSETTYIAFVYTSTGTGGGDGAGWYVNDVKITGLRSTLFEEYFGNEDLGQFLDYSVTSSNDWEYGTADDIGGPYMNGYGADSASDDWAISPVLDLDRYEYATLTFNSYVKYGGGDFKLMISTDYLGSDDPSKATWFELDFNKPEDDSRIWTESGDVDLSAYSGQTAYVAFVYTSTGTGGGDGAGWYFNDVKIKAKDRATTLIQSNFNDESFGAWSAYDVSSNKSWGTYIVDEEIGISIDNYSGDVAAEDWLISSSMDLSAFEKLFIDFSSYIKYSGSSLVLLTSNDYDGVSNPNTANWTTYEFSYGEDDSRVWIDSGLIDLSTSLSDNTTIAFKYTSIGTGSGETSRWVIDNISVVGVPAAGESPLFASFTVSAEKIRTTDEVTFEAQAQGGTGIGYNYSWEFSDGSSAEGQIVTKSFASGPLTATLTVEDSEGNTIEKTVQEVLTVVEAVIKEMKPRMGDVRFASFNSYLNRSSEGQMLIDLESASDQQMQNVAEIIQTVRPDVLLLNEFDYVADGIGVIEFIENYLELSQNGSDPITYEYYFVRPSNTGEPSTHDFDNDGVASGTGNDAYGYGVFPGQYAMVLLSRYPIVEENARTFQEFLWKDMPDAKLPVDPTTGLGYYSDLELEDFRLSSKSHWDVPIEVGSKVIHALCSHPTPPVFDDGTLGVDDDVIDWNGLRNHDEIRFWADYVAGEDYFYDDEGGLGGLNADSRFVILGDQNADPQYGDSTDNPIDLLLSNDLILGEFQPASEGGLENDVDSSEGADNAFDTADWGLRADYVLASSYGFEIEEGAVFWPVWADPLYRLVGPGVKSSDHRLVWLDLSFGNKGLWKNGEDLGDGWKRSNWLGNIWTDAYPWIWLSSEKNWIWVHDESEDGLTDDFWTYDDKTGTWRWQDSEWYPWVYFDQGTHACWSWISTNDLGETIYYILETESWLSAEELKIYLSE